MDARTDVEVADGTPPPGLPDLVAALARRVALLEVVLGRVTEVTMDDLTDDEVSSFTSGATREDELEKMRPARARREAREAEYRRNIEKAKADEAEAKGAAAR